MKLLLITPFPPSKAPEVDHAVHLCNKLAAAGVDVHVLTKKQSKTITYPREVRNPGRNDLEFSVFRGKREVPMLVHFGLDKKPKNRENP
jgi:hypothetical protein